MTRPATVDLVPFLARQLADWLGVQRSERHVTRTGTGAHDPLLAVQ